MTSSRALGFALATGLEVFACSSAKTVPSTPPALSASAKPETARVEANTTISRERLSELLPGVIDLLPGSHFFFVTDPKNPLITGISPSLTYEDIQKDCDKSCEAPAVPVLVPTNLLKQSAFAENRIGIWACGHPHNGMVFNGHHAYLYCSETTIPGHPHVIMQPSTTEVACSAQDDFVSLSSYCYEQYGSEPYRGYYGSIWLCNGQTQLVPTSVSTVSPPPIKSSPPPTTVEPPAKPPIPSVATARPPSVSPDLTKALDPLVISLNDQNFSVEIQKPNVLVMVSAGWCDSCEKLEPKFEQSALQYKGRASFMKILCEDEKYQPLQQICKQNGHILEEIPHYPLFLVGGRGKLKPIFWPDGMRSRTAYLKKVLRELDAQLSR